MWYVMWECMEYEEERNEWLRKWNTCRLALNGCEKLDCIKGYVRNDREMEECSVVSCYLVNCHKDLSMYLNLISNWRELFC